MIIGVNGQYCLFARIKSKYVPFGTKILLIKEVCYENIDLTKYGITGTTEVVYNPSYEMLFEEETNPALEGYEKDKSANSAQSTL